MAYPGWVSEASAVITGRWVMLRSPIILLGSGLWSFLRGVTPLHLLHIGAQHGVHFRLVQAALGTEPGQHIIIQPQRHQALAPWKDQHRVLVPILRNAVPVRVARDIALQF